MTERMPEEMCARCGELVDVHGDWDNSISWCHECNGRLAEEGSRWAEEIETLCEDSVK